MGTTGIQIVIILAYISVLFGISWYVKRRAASSTEDYVLAGRRLTTPLIMVSIVGLAVGGASTIGVAEQAYKVCRLVYSGLGHRCYRYGADRCQEVSPPPYYDSSGTLRKVL